MYWPITMKFRIRKQTSKLQTKYCCCLWFSYLTPYWLISRDTRTFHKYFWCSWFCEFHSKASKFESEVRTSPAGYLNPSFNNPVLCSVTVEPQYYEVLGITNDSLHPVIVKYIEKHLDITNETSLQRTNFVSLLVPLY